MQECDDICVKQNYSIVVGSDGNIFDLGLAQEIF